MGAEKFTQEEANRLLDMVKRSLVKAISFPKNGDTKEFEVVGDNKKDLFIISIYEGKIAHRKFNYGARIKKNNVMLLELHVNPSAVHRNPDGGKIIGSHWHIYTEQYGRSYAFQAEDINNEMFVDNAIKFLDKFNVIEKPSFAVQMEIF